MKRILKIHPEGDMNVCAKLHDNPSKIGPAISVWTKVVEPPTGQHCPPWSSVASVAKNKCWRRESPTTEAPCAALISVEIHSVMIH